MAERLSQRDRRRIAALAVGVVVALFAPFLGAPFEYDDKVEILANRVLRHPGNLGEMVRYNPFRLVLLYTFSWDLWAWGFRPEGYRALNIAIHAANSLLLLSLLDRLGSRVLPRGGSHGLFVAAGTLLFAVHPLAIESVTYISGRSSSLATTFVLLASSLYVGHLELREDPRVDRWFGARTKRLNLALGVLLGAGALTGIPAALLVRSGAVSPERGLAVAGGAAGLLLLGLAAWGAERWRALAPASSDVAVEELGRRTARRLTLAFAVFVLGVLTKEIAATLPGILLAIEALLWRRSWRAALGTLSGRLFPFFAIPAFLILLRLAAYGYIASPEPIRPAGANLLTQIEVIAQYARLWVLPFPQSIYHEYAVVQPPGTGLTWLFAALELAAVAAALRFGRRAPALAFGMLVVAGTLAPTSSVFALKETMVEHRTYLPSIGVAFMAAWAFGHSRLAARPRMGGAILGLMLAGYGALHVSYDLLWRHEERLWSHAVNVNPEASEAWRYLGDLYLGRNRLSDAQRAFERSVDASPWNAEALSKLGQVYGRQGDLLRAELRLQEALHYAPCLAPALNNLAFIARKRGRFQESIELYDQSIGCDPGSYVAHLGLGHIYYSDVRERERAAQHYTRALELLDPLSPDAAMLKTRILELTW